MIPIVRAGLTTIDGHTRAWAMTSRYVEDWCNAHYVSFSQDLDVSVWKDHPGTELGRARVELVLVLKWQHGWGLREAQQAGNEAMRRWVERAEKPIPIAVVGSIGVDPGTRRDYQPTAADGSGF